ncbi:MAG: prepilin peptidase [Clostridia bacterium]|nr:prepilin peptidase [Clostridia bacterium]
MDLFVIALMTFIIGIFIGSFINVYIIRYGTKESFVTGRSHCMSCGKTLKWYDMFPLISYLILGGKCRFCKAKISAQYPVIEFLNGLGYVLILLLSGDPGITTLLYCLCFSSLLGLSMIDIKHYEIPYSANIFITLLGIIALALDFSNWQLYIIGAASVGGLLLLIQILSKGRAMGGGDVFLMASAGLLLGWKKIIAAFVFACIIGSVIHIIIMNVRKRNAISDGSEENANMLPFGPYLAAGIFISMLFGDAVISWYAGMLG